jgi:threonine dehydrogenase-like Zn-dependent dehydrogenase
MDMTPGATQPIVDAIAMARGDGRILLAGLKGRRPVEIMSDMLIMKRLSILTGPGSTPDAMARAAEVLNAGGFPTEALRGEVYTLDQLDEALAMLDRNIEGRDAVRINLVHL